MAARARDCFKVDSDESFRRSPRRARVSALPYLPPNSLSPARRGNWSLQSSPQYAQPRGTLAIRAMLIALAIGTAIMAFERAGLGEPAGGAVCRTARSATPIKSNPPMTLTGALRDLDRALGWSDNSAEIYALRGQVRLEMNDLEGGLADFNKVVSMEPMSSGAYELRSMSLQRLDRHEEAIHDISQAVQMRRSRP